MLKKYKTEQVGISTEIAIGDLTGVGIAAKYRQRGRVELVQHISPALCEVISRIPQPVSHTAEKGNPIDFLLEDDKTLSVKSNMQGLGKVAPQKIGQSSDISFWEHLPHLIPEGIDPKKISYVQSKTLFKQVAISNTAELLTAYWGNTFECDYMIYVYNVITSKDQLTDFPTVKLYGKPESPEWDNSKLTFTQDLSTWNESCTVKIDGISIGEFQVHNNRKCFKFRFNIGGLIEANLL
jgi:hypothetical protein